MHIRFLCFLFWNLRARTTQFTLSPRDWRQLEHFDGQPQPFPTSLMLETLPSTPLFFSNAALPAEDTHTDSPSRASIVTLAGVVDALTPSGVAEEGRSLLGRRDGGARPRLSGALVMGESSTGVHFACRHPLHDALSHRPTMSATAPDDGAANINVAKHPESFGRNASDLQQQIF